MSDATPHLPARFERILADYERRLRILETRLAQPGDTSWTYPATSYQPPNTDDNPRYRKTAGGLIVLGGKIYFATAPATPVALFTLPAGYRPVGTGTGDDPAFHITVRHTAGTKSTGHLHVTQAGAVYVDGFNPSVGDYAHLWGVVFYAET
jgi:hypothetical protein